MLWFPNGVCDSRGVRLISVKKFMSLDELAKSYYKTSAVGIHANGKQQGPPRAVSHYVDMNHHGSYHRNWSSVDMKSRDMTCVNSNLQFVAENAKSYGETQYSLLTNRYSSR